MTPEMEIVKIQQQSQVLAGSGVNDQLQDETVEEGWAPFFDNFAL